MTKRYVAASRSAIATAIRATIDATGESWTSAVDVVTEWPSAAKSTKRATVVVTMSPRATVRTHVPRLASQSDSGGSTEARWHTGRWTSPGQIDVFTQLETHLDGLVPVVRAALNHAVPQFTGACLSLGSDYYNETVTVSLDDEPEGLNDGPMGGEWRHTFAVTVRGAVVATSTHVLEQRFTVTEDGDTIVDISS